MEFHYIPSLTSMNSEDILVYPGSHLDINVRYCNTCLPYVCNEIMGKLTTNNHRTNWCISYLNFNFTTLGSHSCVSVRQASGQDSCSEELGRLAVPQQRKWRAGLCRPAWSPFCCSIFPERKGVCLSDTLIYLQRCIKFPWLVYRKHALCQFLRTKAFKLQELCRSPVPIITWRLVEG